MVYKWKTGAHISADPQVAGEECDRLERDGRLTPKNLLDDSRPEDAPLHGAFEWDDGIAAERYRTEQAAHIIRCVLVVPENDAKRERPPQKFILVSDHSRDDPRKGQYRDTVKAIADPVDRTTVLRNALRELESFRRKYGWLSELCGLFAEIDRLSAEVNGGGNG